MAKLLQKYGHHEGHRYFRGKLYDVGSYPAAIPSSKETDKVFGELFKLTKSDFVFRELDAYEGNDYIRQKTEVYHQGEDTPVSSWIYLYNKSVRKLTPIPGGDYIKYLKMK